MKHEIIGDNLQMVKIDLINGEGIFAEAGAMVNMTGSFQMESQLKGGRHLRTETRCCGGESLSHPVFPGRGGRFCILCRDDAGQDLSDSNL